MQQGDWIKLLFETSPQPPVPRPIGRIANAFAASRYVREILEFVDSYGIPRNRWYAGISAQPVNRLSLAHRIEIGNRAKFWNVGSEEVARAVERRVLQLGLDGGTGGGGDVAPTFVYVYLQSFHTRR